jgi:hypothetical protein
MSSSKDRNSRALGCAGLAEGTNANTFKTSNILHYDINGRCYVKAATDNLAFSSGHTALAAKQICAFFVWLDASGNVTTTQSAIVANSQAAGYVKGAFEWPSEVADSATQKVCVGAIVVDAQNAATFTPNSTDLGATDVVDTYHNVAGNYGVPITY